MTKVSDNGCATGTSWRRFCPSFSPGWTRWARANGKRHMSDAAQPPRDQVRETNILRQVQEALAASDIERAITMARTALSEGFQHPMLLNLRSYWLEQQGRDADALADLALASAMAPNDPLVNNAHGLQLAKMN